MTIAYEVIDCQPSHLHAIIGSLRAGDLAELEATGLAPRRVLWNSYRHSHIKRALLVNGKVAVVGGCSGSLLSPVGHPWLLTSFDVERAPLAFVREAKRELRSVLEIHSTLRNYVAARYHKAIGFLQILGFEISSEEEGMRIGPNKELFLKFEMTRG